MQANTAECLPTGPRRPRGNSTVFAAPAIPSSLCNGPVAWWGIRNPREDERAAPWTLLPSLWGFQLGSHLTAFPTGRLVMLEGEMSSLTQSLVLWVLGGFAGTQGLRGAHGSCASTGGRTRSIQPQVHEPQLNWPGAGVHGHTCKH